VEWSINVLSNILVGNGMLPIVDMTGTRASARTIFGHRREASSMMPPVIPYDAAVLALAVAVVVYVLVGGAR
jgi:hypothetical protein